MVILGTLPVSAVESEYRRRYVKFVRVALGFLGDPDIAHDAVQETFARALRNREALRNDSALATWLWRTLTNLCLDWQRHRSQHLSLNGSQGREQSRETPSVPGFDEMDELRAAIAALPDRQRAAIFLRHYADLNYNQIADVLDIQRGTVAATLNAAHTRLRKSLLEAIDE
jgi:RNA polymerase sigma-70 factor (ECF subfamily)